MLDMIRDLVRNVTIIVVIAGFLEMLLPSSELKKFVKAVLGLFILISMLNPLISLFDKNVTSEVLAWQDPAKNRELNSILSQGEQISQEMDEKTKELYSKNVAKQIETIVKLVKGVAKVDAKVEMDHSNTDSGYDQISRVVLEVSIGEKSNQKDGLAKIDPVEINISPPENDPVENHGYDQIEKEITEALVNFYHLKEDQIKIVIMSQNEEGSKIEQ